MSQKVKSERRIVMARGLARKFLTAQVRPEYRLTIYYVGREIRGIPNLLRGFRDAKLRIGSVEPIPDLGISESYDAVVVWSSQRDALVRLASWFETRGYDTSGVW